MMLLLHVRSMHACIHACMVCSPLILIWDLVSGKWEVESGKWEVGNVRSRLGWLYEEVVSYCSLETYLISYTTSLGTADCFPNRLTCYI